MWHYCTMIPSTTKLVLLYTVLQTLSQGVHPLPKYHAQSQEGDYNVRAEFKDIAIILMPTKELVDSGISMFIGKSPSNSARQVGIDRIKSKYGFVRPEKSPYKVDLEKSTVPVLKVDNMPEAQKAQNLSQTADFDKKTVKKDLQLSEENSNTKDNLDKKEEVHEVPVNMGSADKKEELPAEVPVKVALEKETKEKESITKKEKVNAGKKDPIKKVVIGENKLEKESNANKETDNNKNKVQEKTEKGMKLGGETLILIQEGIEECGPDGHRNEEGICIFTNPSIS